MYHMPKSNRTRPRILVVGGGFAGVYTAYELERRLRDQKPMIDIINRENFFVFYPLIPEIISGTIETEHILTPIRHLLPGTTLFVGEVTGIDLNRQRVDVLHGLYGGVQNVCSHYYDYLVLALGGVPNTTQVPGLAQHAFNVQRLSQVFALRNHLIDVLEQAHLESDPKVRQRLLTFVVIGGGSSGVEVMAEIRDLIHEAVKHYRYLDPREIRLMLIHGGDRILPGMPPKLADFAGSLLRDRGVELLLNRRVIAVEPSSVQLDDGRTITTETVVGSIGFQANPLVRGLPVPHDRQGRVIVNEGLNFHEFPNVWALGDNASIIDPHSGQPYPQSAQHAIREARVVAHNIAARLAGKSPKRIDYRTRGQLVALGRRSAVADLEGRTFSGFIAWWLWRTYYLTQLPHWEKRLRVAVDWTLDLLFPRSLVQLKVGQATPAAGSVRPSDEPPVSLLANLAADDPRRSPSPETTLTQLVP